MMHQSLFFIEKYPIILGNVIPRGIKQNGGLKSENLSFGLVGAEINSLVLVREKCAPNIRDLAFIYVIPTILFRFSS